MTAKLSKELSDALNGADQLEAVDPATGRIYILVEGEVHRRAMQALQRQQDHDAIAEGIAQMEAGGGTPVAEADRLLRQRLAFPPRRDK